MREGKAESDPEAISIWLKAVEIQIERLGLEAGPLSPWLCEGLQAAGLPAVCIETRRMKGATAAMAVTDRNDARAIAQAMRVCWFTAVHLKTAESQELRLLLTNRKTFLTSRVALENEIRGTLNAFELKIGPVSVAAFEARVIELTADQPRLQAIVRPMLAARPALRLQFENTPCHGAQGRKITYRVPPAVYCAGRRGSDRLDFRNCHRRSGTLCPIAM